jgi:hypothetical protein
MSGTNLKTKSKWRDVQGIANYRSTRGSSVSSVLQKAAMIADAPAAICEAVLIRDCASPENIYTGVKLQRKDTKEFFNGVGALTACGSRLCANCVAALSARSRRRARDGMARVGVARHGERERFITLTAPTLPASQVGLVDTIKVLQRAWRLFSKRDWGVKIRAGVKAFEFTMGDEKKLELEGRRWSADIDGYHTHLHLLVLSKFVNIQLLRVVWTECVLKAWSEIGIAAGVNTKDGLCIINIKNVTSRKDAIDEVCKYVTKNNSWDSVPSSQLVQVAQVTRWARMFELLGECREPMKCQENDTLSPSRLGSDDPIDSTPGESETDETKPYLDTPDLSAAEDSEEKEPKQKRIKIQRSISLRKLAKLMSFEQWCLEVTIRRWKQRKFRRRQLSLLHRAAIFELLNGSEFGLQLA